jgi:hypothetical protein
MKSDEQFFQMDLVMFVSSVHYSDHLEHDLCIQDEFTIPTSPCIASSQLVLSSTWQKNYCVTLPQAITVPQRRFNGIMVFSLREVGNSILKLVSDNFYSCYVRCPHKFSTLQPRKKMLCHVFTKDFQPYETYSKLNFRLHFHGLQNLAMVYCSKTDASYIASNGM